MKGKSQFEKWTAGFLGVLCLALILNLVLRGGAKAGGTRPPVRAATPAPGPKSRSAPAKAADELARYDPGLQLDLLKQIQSRELPNLARNPFDFEAREIAVPQQPNAPPTAVAPAPPPKPSPPPLKAVGVTEKAGGLNEAIVTDDADIYIVHEGETFAKRFRVLKISASHVEVTDETTQETIRLPLAP